MSDKTAIAFGIQRNLLFSLMAKEIGMFDIGVPPYSHKPLEYWFPEEENNPDSVQSMIDTAKGFGIDFMPTPDSEIIKKMYLPQNIIQIIGGTIHELVQRDIVVKFHYLFGQSVSTEDTPSFTDCALEDIISVLDEAPKDWLNIGDFEFLPTRSTMLNSLLDEIQDHNTFLPNAGLTVSSKN